MKEIAGLLWSQFRFQGYGMADWCAECYGEEWIVNRRRKNIPLSIEQ